MVRGAQADPAARMSDASKVNLPSDVIDSLSDKEKEELEKNASTYSQFCGQ